MKKINKINIISKTFNEIYKLFINEINKLFINEINKLFINEINKIIYKKFMIKSIKYS
jgi:hypothetical protein